MQRVSASWGVTEQQHWELLPFPWERAAPAELGKDGQRGTDGPAANLEHVDPQNPISSVSRESNSSILAHYSACVCWRNDENKHLRALKAFVPLLILSISSKNRWSSILEKQRKECCPKPVFLVFLQPSSPETFPKLHALLVICSAKLQVLIRLGRA